MDCIINYLKETGPEWVQAWATLGALVVAVIVVWLQRHLERSDEKQEKRLRGRFIAISIYPQLLELKAKIHAAKQRIFLAPDLAHAKRGESVLKLLIVEIPPIFAQQLRSFHLLGEEVGGNLAQLLSVLTQYGAALEKLRRTSSMNPPNQKAITFLTVLLDVSEKCLSEALEKIGAIHDNQVMPE